MRILPGFQRIFRGWALWCLGLAGLVCLPWIVSAADLRKEDPTAEAGLEPGVKDGALQDRWLEVKEKHAEAHKAGNVNEQLRLAQEAYDLSEKAFKPAHPSYAISIADLAAAFQEMGYYRKAEPLLQRVVAVRRETVGEKDQGYARSLSNLAQFYSETGQYSKAEELFQRTLAIFAEVIGTNELGYLITLHNLAAVYRRAGKLALAEPLMRQVLDGVSAKLGETNTFYASALSAQAGLLHQLGDPGRAKVLYEKTLALRRQIHGERHPYYLDVLANLATVLEDLGARAEAEVMHLQALNLRKDILGENHPDVALSVNNLAAFYENAGDNAKAEAMYRQALKGIKSAFGVKHPQYAAALNNLAISLNRQGKLAEAEALSREGVSIQREVLGAKHPDSVTSSLALARVLYDQEKYCEARELCESVVRTAREHLTETFGILPERRQLQVFSRHLWVLKSYMVSVLRCGGSPVSMYEEWLQWKGMVLQQQVWQREANQIGALPPQWENLRRTKQELADLVMQPASDSPYANKVRLDRITKLDLEQERLESELAAISADFALAQSRQRLAPEALCDLLPENAVLLDFMPYTMREKPTAAAQPLRRVGVFILSRAHRVQWSDLGEEAKVVQAVEAWRQAIQAHVDDATAEATAGRDLCRLIWEPIRAHCAHASLVLVSPTGVIGQVPFAALPGTNSGDYLVQEKTFINVPVVQMLKQRPDLRGTNRSPRQLLVVGDVSYDALPGSAGIELAALPVEKRGGRWRSFPSLPETRGELLAVRDSYELHFPNGRVRSLRQAEATEMVFRELAPGSRWVHVATHGFFNPVMLREDLKHVGFDDAPGARGYLSGLAFAGANQRELAAGQADGILTANEVMGMELRDVELVTLSACETGLGEVAEAEGLLGLQRAFQVAGAHSVLGSLWKVDDQWTRKLMERFYQELWGKNRTKAEALRQAQLQLMQEAPRRGLVINTDSNPPVPRVPSPYYWASFTLSGDWR